MPINLTPVTPALTAIYGTYDDLVAEMGAANIDLLADPDGDGVVFDINNYKQHAMTFADTYINNELDNNGYTVPTTENLDQLVYIWAKFAAYQIYQLRGTDPAKGGYFVAKLQDAKDMLTKLTFGNRGGFKTTTAQTPLLIQGGNTYG